MMVQYVMFVLLFQPFTKTVYTFVMMVLLLKEDMLIIKRISWKHSGIYQCFATNQLDTTWASCVVTVTERNGTTLHHDLLYDVDTTEGNLPGLDEDDGSEALEKNYAMLVPPSRPDLTPLSDDSVMVRWTVHHNDGLPILFFKVQYKISGGHWMTIDEDIAPHIHSYAVTELEPGTSYRFRIAAVYSNYDNNHGPSSSYMLSKDPPMKKPVIGPIILLAKTESPSAITIQWV
ncbi:interference hedgehog-like, partial [Limulus polyphemus]|uniref:Interference hedgehog-like n=1 Tax=Limulus polyphemus TaxID=6850 RepID=A0ABM1RZA3_LIMPO